MHIVHVFRICGSSWSYNEKTRLGNTCSERTLPEDVKLHLYSSPRIVKRQLFKTVIMGHARDMPTTIN